MQTKTAEHIKIIDYSDEIVLTRVPMREYIRNYKKYNDMVNETKENIIITNQDVDTIMLAPVIHKKKRWTDKDFDAMRFNGGKNLSRDIDKIVYGI